MHAVVLLAVARQHSLVSGGKCLLLLCLAVLADSKNHKEKLLSKVRVADLAMAAQYLQGTELYDGYLFCFIP